MNYLILLLILLLTTPCIAQEQQARMSIGVMGGAVAAAGCADASCTGFILCQNFETATTGYDNSETWDVDTGAGATIYPAYTTTPIRGSQSLYFDNGTGSSSIYHSITAAGELYGFFRVKVASAGGTSALFDLASGFTVIKRISWNVNNSMFVTDGNYTTSTYAAGTLVYVWLYYKKGASSTGIFKVWTSTTSSKPATAEIDFLHSDDTDINRIFIANAGSTQDAWFDQILLKATVIGDVCN